MDEPRHYLAIIGQDERGYSEKPEDDRPKDPMLWTVVKKDDYDELRLAYDKINAALYGAEQDRGALLEQAEALSQIHEAMMDNWMSRSSMTAAECIRLILSERDMACRERDEIFQDYLGMERDWLDMGDLNAELEAKVINQYSAEVANRETRKAEGRAYNAELRAATYLKALELIVKDGGAVCPEFTTCDHAACNASCHTWMIANDVLPKEVEV